MHNSLDNRSILVVDDTPENIDVLKGLLVSDYQVRAATSGALAIKIAETHSPDLILLDVMMPQMDGYETCRILKSNPVTAKIPVIFVTALSEIDDERKGFDVGAVDYVIKPINPGILTARVKTHLALADQQRACEEKVQRRTHDLEQSYRSAIYMLGEAGHLNDSDTGVHIWRMAAYSSALARAAQWPVAEAARLELAAPMHDTGKIGISDTILKAPRKLTDEEWVIMKTHTEIGHRILSKSDAPVFRLAAEIALYHHEKWDGSGYPLGLKGEAIPESARIVAIADVFDALTMQRPYKEPWPIDKALDTLRQDAGKHFDARLVDLFFGIEDEIRELKAEWDAVE